MLTHGNKPKINLEFGREYLASCPTGRNTHTTILPRLWIETPTSRTSDFLVTKGSNRQHAGVTRTESYTRAAKIDTHTISPDSMRASRGR
jgi:hypothetical protein